MASAALGREEFLSLSQQLETARSEKIAILHRGFPEWRKQVAALLQTEISTDPEMEMSVQHRIECMIEGARDSLQEMTKDIERGHIDHLEVLHAARFGALMMEVQQHPNNTASFHVDEIDALLTPAMHGMPMHSLNEIVHPHSHVFVDTGEETQHTEDRPAKSLAWMPVSQQFVPVTLSFDQQKYCFVIRRNPSDGMRR
ncbi:MAG TPA: hypothetical protein VI873_00660, partial [Candidatus Peribacteraceae bacterium]|nr:hypothetical protein [Candidatus Peribacteraceae bacterium]